MTLSAIHRVGHLDLTFEDWRWPFAKERRAEIDAYFSGKRAEIPALWNGRILLGRNPVFDGGRFRSTYFEADFASFLAWRDWGFPDDSVFNGFGMGALRGSDGTFVMGEMAADTANAGRIYFPSGTPDLSDLKGATVDIAGSILREVEEETGLSPSDYRADPSWYCIERGAVVAVIQILDVDMPGAMLLRRLEANLAAQRSPELRAIHLVRGPRDFTPDMPVYVTDFVDHVIATAG